MVADLLIVWVWDAPDSFHSKISSLIFLGSWHFVFSLADYVWVVCDRDRLSRAIAIEYVYVL